MRARSVAVLLAALVLGSCSAQAPAGAGAGAAGPLPPVGVVWFGTSFQPGTTTIVGQTTTVKQGTPVVALGRFLTAKSPEDLTVQIVLLGTTRARLPLPPGAPSTSFGIDLSAQKLGPGPYQVNFVDTKRRTLASGTLTVTP